MEIRGGKGGEKRWKKRGKDGNKRWKNKGKKLENEEKDVEKRE